MWNFNQPFALHDAVMDLHMFSNAGCAAYDPNQNLNLKLNALSTRECVKPLNPTEIIT
jgi:hypothetical protein